MFDEIQSLIEDFQVHLGNVKRAVIFGGDYFHALALAEAYNLMISYADTRSREHPEVQRVPELRNILLQHFFENADRHINIRAGTIFNEQILGGPNTVREWQEAGYHARRSSANYEKRLRYWKSIYDGAPVIFQQRIPAQEEIFSTSGRIYQATFLSPQSKDPKKQGQANIPRRATNRATGNLVTYEDVIHSRNTQYGAQLVPWWRLLNYGTGGKGYPISPALHFVEDAERQVPAIIQKYMDLFETFVSDIFDDENLTGDDQLTVESWVRGRINIGPEYVPAFDVARIIAFGVPF